MGVDPFKTTETLEADKETNGGVPVKDKLTFKAPERKSRLGLDARAIEKKDNAKTEGEFKVPKKSAISVTSSLDEEDKSDVSGLDFGTENTRPVHSSRRYREKSSRSQSAQESTVTTENAGTSDISITPRTLSCTSSYERGGSNRHREEHRRDRSETPRSRQRNTYDEMDHYRRRESYRQSDRDYHGEKRRRYNSDWRTPGRSDWDDGQDEWERSPHGDRGSSYSRRPQPSPSPMLAAASPDARLASPWLDTPRSTMSSASPWDMGAPSPIPIRASGSSIRSSSSRYGGRSNQLAYSREGDLTNEGHSDEDRSQGAEEFKHEITETMRVEMEYQSDRA